MKKVLSLVLVIAMVLSSMSFAFAAPATTATATAATALTDIAGSDYEDAVNTLVALGIVAGYPDGTFKLDRTVTRAEMAKLMVITLGYGDLVAGSKSNFADTQGHWADAYIALAAGKNIVKGYPDGTFKADQTVSYDEAITMVVRALGYTDTCSEIANMAWPTNYKVKAAELDLTDGVALKTTGADRGGVAQIIFNALEATLVSVDSKGDVTFIKDGTDARLLLSRIAEKVGTEDKPYHVDAARLDSKSKTYAGNVVDLSKYLYEDVQVYVDKNDTDTVVYVAKSYTDTVEGTFKANNPSSTDKTDNGKVNIKLADGTTETYKITSSVPVYYNGKETSSNLSESNMEDGIADKLVSLADATAKFVYDSNDNVTAVVATKATYGDQISKTYRADALKLDTIVLPQKDGSVDLSKVTVTGAVDNINDIEKDDVVIAYASQGDNNKVIPSKLTLVVSNDTVKGTVTKTTDTAKTVYIDGQKYSVSDVEGTMGANAVAVNDEGTFFLDNAGKIFAVDTTTELADYGVIVAAPEQGTTKTSFGSTTVKDLAQIKIATADNERVVFNILTTFDDSKIDEVANIVDAKGVKVAPVVTFGDSNDVDTKDLEVNGTLKAGVLVKYSVDADGKLDKIELINTVPETIDKDDLDLMTTENTLVFDATGTTPDYNVVSLDSLKDNTEHQVAYFTSGSDKGKVAVIISTNVKSVNDGVYGVISDVNYVQNSNGDKVVEVTALVNGKEVTYLTGKNATIGSLGFDWTTTNAAFRFTFNTSDVLTGVVAIDPTTTADAKVTASLNVAVTDIDEVGMIVDGVQKYFASDVAVYIYDKSADEIRLADYSELLETGDTNYVATSAYVIDNADSTRIDVIVQVVK